MPTPGDSCRASDRRAIKNLYYQVVHTATVCPYACLQHEEPERFGERGAPSHRISSAGRSARQTGQQHRLLRVSYLSLASTGPQDPEKAAARCEPHRESFLDHPPARPTQPAACPSQHGDVEDQRRVRRDSPRLLAAVPSGWGHRDTPFAATPHACQANVEALDHLAPADPKREARCLVEHRPCRASKPADVSDLDLCSLLHSAPCPCDGRRGTERGSTPRQARAGRMQSAPRLK